VELTRPTKKATAAQHSMKLGLARDLARKTCLLLRWSSDPMFMASFDRAVLVQQSRRC
jgi:hypothetical protein